jgi:hypothetical protein
MKAKDRLNALYLEHQRNKNPNIPEYGRLKYARTDKTANGLTRMIIDWITWNGGQAERINTMGRYVAPQTIFNEVLGKEQTVGKGSWIKGTGTRGSADISAVVRGRSVKIEVKIGKDRQSEHQKKYEHQITSAGGVYVIARTFEQFVAWWDSYLESL